MFSNVNLAIVGLVFLLGGATAGIYLAFRHFTRQKMPVWVAILHGLGGASGFALVLFAVVSDPGYQPFRNALYLLTATVLLGAVNLLFHIRKKRHRTSLILLHGALAVSSASTVVYGIYAHRNAPDSSVLSQDESAPPQRP
jgi:hypothetical protein